MDDHFDQISRVTRTKEEAKAGYDSLGRWYDMLVGWGEKKFRDAGLEKIGVKEGEWVLEIGFGTGECTLAFARAAGDSGKVCGLDLSEGMLAVTRSKLDRTGLAGRVELKLGDAAALPYEADSFDAVFTSFTLELFDTPEIPVVLQQCRRVLKSGGRNCVVAMSRQGKSNLPVRLYEWAHAKFPNTVDCRPIYVRKSLEDAGFRNLDATALSYWGIPVEIVLAQK